MSFHPVLNARAAMTNLSANMRQLLYGLATATKPRCTRICAYMSRPCEQWLVATTRTCLTEKWRHQSKIRVASWYSCPERPCSDTKPQHGILRGLAYLRHQGVMSPTRHTFHICRGEMRRADSCHKINFIECPWPREIGTRPSTFSTIFAHNCIMLQQMFPILFWLFPLQIPLTKWVGVPPLHKAGIHAMS